MPLFEDMNISGSSRRNTAKARTRKFITPEDSFWLKAERVTDEEWAILEMIEEAWEAGRYDIGGGPSAEWLREKQLRECPYRNAIQLDLLDALREPCRICGLQEPHLVYGLCSVCDQMWGCPQSPAG
jgi:hypothetical protein